MDMFSTVNQTKSHMTVQMRTPHAIRSLIELLLMVSAAVSTEAKYYSNSTVVVSTHQERPRAFSTEAK